MVGCRRVDAAATLARAFTVERRKLGIGHYLMICALGSRSRSRLRGPRRLRDQRRRRLCLPR
eukprot:7268362-Pyramimonas_sp.AAC.1